VIEYVLVLAEQTVVVPEIVPGVAGIVFTVIANVCAEEEPHTLLATTITLPLVADAVTSIEFVVEVPVQPKGSVHV
jgi:hypothetical protein